VKCKLTSFSQTCRRCCHCRFYWNLSQS